MLNLQMLVPEYVGILTKIMDDGGATYGAITQNAVLRWELLYADYLTATESAMLDNHHNSCRHQYLGFDFRDWRTGILYNDVHYESFEYPKHLKIWAVGRRVVLVKRPS